MARTVRHSPDRRRGAGFTLLEMLVVLVMLGLLTAIVMPRLSTILDRVRAGFERDDVVSELGGLAYQAYLQGREFELGSYPGDAAVPLNLPEGWRVKAEPPVRFRATGVCDGGELTLAYGDQSYRVLLKAPACTAELR